MPSGTELNRPTDATGQIRNNTNESSQGSASAQEYYNGTEWKKITNVFPISSNIITVTDTQKFNRNQSTPSDSTRYTYSLWVKWTSVATGTNMLIGTGQYPSAVREEMSWDGANSRWILYFDSGSAGQGAWITPSVSTPTTGVWYHYCLTKEGTKAPTFYINGTSIGTFTSTQSPKPVGDGVSTRINGGTDAHRINGPQWTTSAGMNASLAYCQFVDGQLRPPSNFTTTFGSLTIPATYSATAWGNNGWQLLFGNPSSIGTDTSGNGNNFSTVPAAITGTDSIYY